MCVLVRLTHIQRQTPDSHALALNLQHKETLLSSTGISAIYMIRSTLINNIILFYIFSTLSKVLIIE